MTVSLLSGLSCAALEPLALRRNNFRESLAQPLRYGIGACSGQLSVWK